MEQVEYAVVAEGNLPKVKELRKTLEGSGVSARIMNPDENCKSGG